MTRASARRRRARPHHAEPPARTPAPAAKTGDFARIYVSIGQAAGAQPGDLVGAITGEAKLDGSAIGAVEIEERYSLVEVREDRADEVLQALQGKTIRGRPVTVSRYQTDKSGKEAAATAKRWCLDRPALNSFRNEYPRPVVRRPAATTVTSSTVFRFGHP